MAVVLIEGWDYHKNNANVDLNVSGGQGWSAGGFGTATIPSAASDPFSRQYLACATNNAMRSYVFTGNAECVVSTWFRSPSTVNHFYLEFANSDLFANHISLHGGQNRNGSFRIMPNNGVPMFSTVGGGGVIKGVWQFLQMYVKISDTVGAVKIELDGMTLCDKTNIDTRTGSGNIDVGRVSLLGICDWGDTIIRTGVSTFLKPFEVVPFTPNGDGGTLNFTATGGSTHYTEVDDGASPDDATTYVSSNTVGHIDKYTMPDNSDTRTILGVQLQVRGENNASSTNKLITRLEDGTNVVSSAAMTGVSGYRFFSYVRELAPDGTSWDDTDLDNLIASLEISA